MLYASGHPPSLLSAPKDGVAVGEMVPEQLSKMKVTERSS